MRYSDFQLTHKFTSDHIIRYSAPVIPGDIVIVASYEERAIYTKDTNGQWLRIAGGLFSGVDGQDILFITDLIDVDLSTITMASTAVNTPLVFSGFVWGLPSPPALGTLADVTFDDIRYSNSLLYNGTQWVNATQLYFVYPDGGDFDSTEDAVPYTYYPQGGDFDSLY